MFLGAIADDLTGATDLALMIARQGMKTVQVIGSPPEHGGFGDAEAVVIALKSRTIAPAQAVSLSLAAARALREAGAEQLFFKYCSTFDSTDEGNIGPVAEALMEFAGADLTIACPAFPATGRSIYKGYLFVGDVLLSESPMKDHPLTPMRDSNLRRVLQRQARGKVGLVPLDIVDQGAAAIREAFSKARARGERLLIVDAVRDENLRAIGAACAGMALVTGGSGVAMGLPENFRAAGKLGMSAPPQTLVAPPGRAAILAGSCSTATRGQIRAALDAGVPAFRIDPLEIASGAVTPQRIVDWAVAAKGPHAPLIYSSDEPDAVRGVQARLGVAHAGEIVENFLAEVGRLLLARGFTRFLVAGGETSGAVVAALGVSALHIGPEIDPGIPWTRSIGRPDVALALKSGNFGATDFFLKAWSKLN